MTRSTALNKSQKWVELIRYCYPAGTPIVCDGMDDPMAVPAGTRGIIRYVDDAGQIHVAWENGASLPLVSGIDHFHCLGREGK